MATLILSLKYRTRKQALSDAKYARMGLRESSRQYIPWLTETSPSHAGTLGKLLGSVARKLRAAQDELVTMRRERKPLPLFVCSRCGRLHESLWTIKRRRAGELGHFVAFRVNGKSILYDPTLPHEVDRLPRDASPVPQSQAEASWHADGHYFGA